MEALESGGFDEWKARLQAEVVKLGPGDYGLVQVYMKVIISSKRFDLNVPNILTWYHETKLRRHVTYHGSPLNVIATPTRVFRCFYFA